MSTKSTAVAKSENNIVVFQTYNPSEVDSIPNLNEFQPEPMNLACLYWSPEHKDESKLVFFLYIKDDLVPSQENPDETVLLETAFFVEQLADGTTTQIKNASKRLVGTMKEYNVQSWTPFQITYKGKVKNKNNQYKSDFWEVKPLSPKKA